MNEVNNQPDECVFDKCLLCSAVHVAFHTNWSSDAHEILKRRISVN